LKPQNILDDVVLFALWSSFIFKIIASAPYLFGAGGVGEGIFCLRLFMGS